MATLITAEDTRALMRLANEVGALHHRTDQCATHLAKGIAAIYSAKLVGIGRVPAEYADSHRFPAPIEPYVPLAFSGPVTHEQAIRIIEGSREAENRDPGCVYMAAHRDCAISALREDIVSDEVWFSSGYYQTVLKPAGLHDKIYTSITPSDSDTIVACVARGPGDPKFTERDTALLGVIRDSLLPWFAELVQSRQRSTAAGHPDLELTLKTLSTNQLMVLALLLDGLSETEIGARICRSKHTVHDHVKRLYTMLDVNSRVELGLKLADHRSFLDSLVKARPALYRGVAPN